MNFKEYCESLEAKIIQSYTEGVSLDTAEKLAGEFLVAQLKVSRELAKKDLDSRMRKQGVKAIRAALYTKIKGEVEKITEAAMTAQLDNNELVSGEQTSYDEAEVNKAELERYYEVFQAAHVYYRQTSRGVSG